MRLNRVVLLVLTFQMFPVVAALVQGEWKALAYVGATIVGGWVFGLFAAFCIHDSQRER